MPGFRAGNAGERPRTPGRVRRAAGGSPGRPGLTAAIALLLSTALLLSSCGGGASVGPPPPPPGAVPAGQSIGAASIAGRVLYRGTPPPRKPLKMSGEAACRHTGQGALSEDVIVNSDGTLQNVHVHVVSGLGDRVFAPPPVSVTMDQKGCVFIPHLVALQVNQVIVFKNSDPAVHNVRSVSQANPPFNIAMSSQGREVRRYFGKPEVVRIRCDIHAWMSAVLAVEGHPFFSVTGETGAFTIAGLPAGSYEIEAWHESLGATRQSITVGENERRDLEFSFGP